ncbi:MAG: hypothetical protein WA359_12425 [Acidimicrobiales bacterium]
MTHHATSDQPDIPLPKTSNLDVIVLPSEITELGIALYEGTMVTSVKELKELGVKAEFANPPSERAWITQESLAGEGINIVVGILSAGGWDAIKALVLRRTNGHVRARIFSGSITKDGIQWNYFSANGTGEAVGAQIDAYLGSGEASKTSDEERK